MKIFPPHQISLVSPVEKKKQKARRTYSVKVLSH